MAAREALGGALAGAVVASKAEQVHAVAGHAVELDGDVSWSSPKMLMMSSSSATEYESSSTAKGAVASANESTD
jgi:hypothetical protein